MLCIFSPTADWRKNLIDGKCKAIENQDTKHRTGIRRTKQEGEKRRPAKRRTENARLEMARYWNQDLCKY